MSDLVANKLSGTRKWNDSTCYIPSSMSTRHPS